MRWSDTNTGPNESRKKKSPPQRTPRVQVGEPPGSICYTYAQCMELIRAGSDIDYEGITGNGTYSEGGVNHVVQAYTPFNVDGSAGRPVLLDAERALEIIEKIKTEATCDSAEPPNSCEW